MTSLLPIGSLSRAAKLPRNSTSQDSPELASPVRRKLCVFHFFPFFPTILTSPVLRPQANVPHVVYAELGIKPRSPGKLGQQSTKRAIPSAQENTFLKSFNIVLCLRSPAQVMCLFLNYPCHLCGQTGPVPSRSHATLISFQYLYKTPEVIT